jgi:hypothetical protein
MAKVETQISAHVSVRTKEMVERYTEARGVKKAHLIEEALLHHLQALRELPADIIIPPRIVVDEESAKALQERVEKPRRPTRAMKDLFSRE